MAAPRRTTPIRDALKGDSSLQPRVCDGLGAVKERDRSSVADDVKRLFADSIDLDRALEEEHPSENRWDYLLGLAKGFRIVGLEPHSAKADQITTVIKKKQKAQQQIVGHLNPGKRVSRWFWVASGRVQFANTENARRRLDQSGIKFVGRQLLANHLA